MRFYEFHHAGLQGLLIGETDRLPVLRHKLRHRRLQTPVGGLLLMTENLIGPQGAPCPAGLDVDVPASHAGGIERDLQTVLRAPAFIDFAGETLIRG